MTYYYILFRQIHLSILMRDGFVKTINLVSYLNYNLAFWTFLFGPIQGFHSFQVEVKKMIKNCFKAENVLSGINRILLGYLKKAYVADYLFQIARARAFPASVNSFDFLFFVVFNTAAFYITLSGMLDMFIGAGKIVGFTIPEDFHYAFLARNWLDFFHRWHITLCKFFRNYLFFPVVFKISKRFSLSVAIVLGCFITFIVVELWHTNVSVHSQWVFNGILLSLEVMGTIGYNQLLKSFLNADQMKKYNTNTIIRVFAIVLFQLNCGIFIILNQYPLFIL